MDSNFDFSDFFCDRWSKRSHQSLVGQTVSYFSPLYTAILHHFYLLSHIHLFGLPKMSSALALKERTCSGCKFCSLHAPRATCGSWQLFYSLPKWCKMRQALLLRLKTTNSSHRCRTFCLWPRAVYHSECCHQVLYISPMFQHFVEFALISQIGFHSPAPCWFYLSFASALTRWLSGSTEHLLVILIIFIQQSAC